MPVSSSTRTSGLTTAIRAPTPDLQNHTTVLTQLKEAVEVGQRLRGDPSSSFVTLGELQNAGVVKAVGSVVAAGSAIGASSGGGSGTVTTALSVTGTGASGTPVELVNDAATPGNSQYYGTNSSGSKGWYTLPGGFSSPLTTKGDILAYSTTNARLPVGTNGQFLGADSTQTTGLHWLTLQAQHSVSGLGTVASPFQLTNDTASPGNSMLYGTNGSGTLGWYAQPSGSGGVTSIVNTDGTISVAGTTTVTLGINKVPMEFGAAWGNGTNAVSTSTNAVLRSVPFACTLKEVLIYTQGGSGSCTISVWKCAYSALPPTSGGDITGGVSPAISSGIKYDNTTLSGWTTSFSAGDCFLFTLSASSTFTYVAILFRVG
jgi:hypothetical protein